MERGRDIYTVTSFFDNTLRFAINFSPSSRKVSSALMHCVEEELVGFSRDDLMNLKMKILDHNTILMAPSWIDSTRRGIFNLCKKIDICDI